MDKRELESDSDRATHLPAQGVEYKLYRYLSLKTEIYRKDEANQKRCQTMKRWWDAHPEVKEERRQAMISYNKSRVYSPEHRQQKAEDMKAKLAAGKMIRIHTVMENQRQSKFMKNNNPMKDPIYREKVAIATRHRVLSDPTSFLRTWKRDGPNNDEAKVAKLIEPLGFKYVGNGQFWIGPCQSGKCRNPDFIWESGKTKIALLYHSTYWHNPRWSNDVEELQDYETEGWQVFVVREPMLHAMSITLEQIRIWLHDRVTRRDICSKI